MIPLAAALLTSMFLFYIDEGNYNFNYLTEFWNLVILVIYTLGIFTGQLAFRAIFFRNDYSRRSVAWTSTVGLIFGVISTIGIFLLIMSIS